MLSHFEQSKLNKGYHEADLIASHPVSYLTEIGLEVKHGFMFISKTVSSF